jgi:hypothetical protein
VLRSKATWIGTVQARNEAEAIRKAFETFHIRKAEAWRISVRRQECAVAQMRPSLSRAQFLGLVKR